MKRIIGHLKKRWTPPMVIGCCCYCRSLSTHEDATHITTAFPQTSLLDRIDGAWTATFEWLGIPHFGFIDSGVAWLELAHHASGIPWSVLLFGLGFALRLATLPFSMLGERAAIRVAKATDETRSEFAKFQEVYRLGTAARAEVIRAAEEMKAARAAAFARHRTSNRALLTPLLGSPLLMLGLSMVLRLLHEQPRSVLADAGVLWLPSIMLPDPTGITPVLSVLLTLLNFEMTFRRRRGPAAATQRARLPLAVARAVALLSIPVVVGLRSGTALYWAGMSCAGLLQPLLFGSSFFREAFGVPSLPPHAPESSATPTQQTPPQEAP